MPDTNEYWRGKIDQTLKDIIDTLKKMDASREVARKEWEERQDHYDKRLDQLEEKISVWSTAIKTVKAISLILIAIAAFKWGDISTIWAKVFN